MLERPVRSYSQLLYGARGESDVCSFIDVDEDRAELIYQWIVPEVKAD